MKLETMIGHMEDYAAAAFHHGQPGDRYGAELFDSVIAALRAGQKMRDAVLLNHLGHEEEAGTYVAYFEITEAAQAWDVAVKEEE